MGVSGMGFFLENAKKARETAELNVNPAIDEMRALASKGERTTEFGSPSYVTEIRNRSAKFTEIIHGEPSQEQKNFIEKIVSSLKGRKLISVQRTMCLNPEMELQCLTLIPEEFARVPLMWAKSLFQPKGEKADMVLVDVPDWPERKVLVSADESVTFACGTDYFGECKKAHLRMAM